MTISNIKNIPLVTLTLEELLLKEIPKRNNLLTPWLPSQGLCMLYSTRGLGKTWMALGIAHAVASNDSFLAPPCYPFEVAKNHKNIYLEVPNMGGHVGFHVTKLE